MLKKIFLIAIGYLMFSCTINQPKVAITENHYFNKNSMAIAVAFKTNVYIMPGSYNNLDIVARLNKDDIVTAVGFEKGFIKVMVSGQVGYISEQYLNQNPFFDYWKEQVLLSMKM